MLMQGQEGWIILRCAGRSTLRLAASLAEDGFTTWTPTVLLGQPKAPAPIVPTYVFAQARHLWTLVDMAEDPTHRHDGFTVFRHYDRYPVVEDSELEPLRYEERKGVPPEQRRVFLPGEEVRVTCGPGAGKKGIIEYAKGKFAMVDFGGSMRVKINAFILQPIVANSGSADNGSAAQAA
jgi:hypothetical protein